MLLIQSNPITNSQILKHRQLKSDCGAVVDFIGIVRSKTKKGLALQHLYIECYVELANSILLNRIHIAKQMFAVSSIFIIHRIGQIQPNELIVYVSVAAKHRHTAYRCNQYVMDYLKSEAPFWKYEQYIKNGQVTKEWLQNTEQNSELDTKWLHGK